MKGNGLVTNVFVLSFLCLYALVGGCQLEAQQKQRPFERTLWGGVHLGVDASRFVFVPRVSQRWYIAPKAGAMLRLDVERGASIQIEAKWMGLGWTERYDEPTISYTRRFTAIEIPVLAHLYVGNRALRLFVNAGPSFGYYLSETSSSKGEDRFTPSQQVRHGLPLRNKVSWGIVGGLGLGISLTTRHRLELEGRFVYGFGDIWSNKRVDPYGQSSPMTIGVSANYLFRF